MEDFRVKASAVVSEYCAGLQDAISVHRTLLFYIHSKQIRICTIKCVVLNGLIFLGSIFFFDRVVIPIIHLFGEALHTSGAYRDTQAEWVREAIDGLVFLLYQVLWMYPIYCISFILNTIWYQEIADEAYLQHHGTPRTTAVTTMIRDEVYRGLLVTSFVIQISACYLIPFIGPAMSFIYMSWLYSLYCFEYKWSLHGWSLERRLNHLEHNWAFFAGFGGPFTFATFFVPSFVSRGIFALLFPIFLLLAICCEPAEENSVNHTERFPIFRHAKWLSLKLLRIIGKWSGVRNKHHQRREKKATK